MNRPPETRRTWDETRQMREDFYAAGMRKEWDASLLGQRLALAEALEDLRANIRATMPQWLVRLLRLDAVPPQDDDKPHG